MPVLIDGNNLLFAARQFAALRMIERDQLCRFIGRWARERDTEVRVVFDGPSPPLAVVHRMRASGVDVCFSGVRTADDVIVEILESAQASGGYTVVSSDHAIQHVARYRRAVGIDAEDFARELLVAEAPAEASPAVEPPEKPDSLCRDEADEWLRRFGHDPDEPPDDTELMM